jgi:hypothetical protein
MTGWRIEGPAMNAVDDGAAPAHALRGPVVGPTASAV